jgi:membrane protein
MMLGNIWTMLKETVNGYIEDNALSRGAAIAYFTVFSIAPMLVICIAIAGLVFGQEAAQGAIVGQLQGIMGKQGAEAIQAMIASAGNKSSGIWATVIGLVTLLLTATGVFGEMQTSLNAIWKAEPKAGVSGLLRARAASLGLIAALGFLLIVSLVASTVLSALGDYLSSMIPGAKTILQVVNFIVSFLLISVLFAAVYKILPDRQLSYRDVAVGAVATAFLFTVGKTLIGLYIGSSSVASSYGAAGALVIVLLWIYYSSQIFLLGAEFTKVWASHHGSAEAFAAASAPGGAVVPSDEPSTAVQKVLVHSSRQRQAFGVFEVAALGTLIVAAYLGETRRR